MLKYPWIIYFPCPLKYVIACYFFCQPHPMASYLTRNKVSSPHHYQTSDPCIDFIFLIYSAPAFLWIYQEHTCLRAFVHIALCLGYPSYKYSCGWLTYLIHEKMSAYQRSLVWPPLLKFYFVLLFLIAPITTRHSINLFV